MKADETCATRFEQFDLHDSRLLGLSVRRRSDVLLDDIVLDLSLLIGRHPTYEEQKAKVTFYECTALSCNVNLFEKQGCGDAIHAARVRRESGEALNDWRFTVELCPPGGDLEIVAKDFSVEVINEGGQLGNR